MKISIICPSRSRPELALRMAHSALDTATGPVEVLLGMDQDDPKLKDYYKLIDQDQGIPLFTFSSGTVGHIWNELALDAIAQTVDEPDSEQQDHLFLMANDDIVFMTMGWDELFAKAARQYPDRIFVLWGNDGINEGNHAAFPCVSRRWIDLLGYFCPTDFKFFRHDTWLYDLGRRIGRLHYVPDAEIKHLHWSTGGVKDEVTDRNRSSGQSQADQRIWAETDHRRAEDAAKLQEALMMRKVRST
jgi:hypothetical protein